MFAEYGAAKNMATSKKLAKEYFDIDFDFDFDFDFSFDDYG